MIDVREPFEWEAGRIEGSRHIPMGELSARIREIEKERPAVAVCFAGSRSAYASHFLQAQGLRSFSLEGGLQSWVRQGLPLVAEKGAPGRLVHDPPSSAASGRPLQEERPEASQEGEESALAEDGEREGLSAEMEELKSNFVEVVFAAQERFGGREPPEEEMRQFIKEWLISKGKSSDEAEEILNR